MPAPDDKVYFGASLESRDGGLTKGALVTNGYAEPPWVHKRGGLTVVASTGTGVGQGITNFIDTNGEEYLYAVAGQTLYAGGVQMIASASWTSGTQPSGVANPIYCSFGGYLWAFGSVSSLSRAYYKSATSDSSWTQAATDIGSGVNMQGGNMLVYQKAIYWIPGGTTTKGVWRSYNGISWTQLTSTAPWVNPTGSLTVAFVVLGTTMYVIRSDGGSLTNTVYSSTDNGTTWSLVTSSPSWGGSISTTWRRDFSCCVFAGKIWLVGGSVNSTHKNDVWYSTDGNTWTQATAAAAWAARRWPNLVSFGGLLYLVGGRDSSTIYQNSYSTPDGITWTLRQNTTVSATFWQVGGSAYPHAFLHKGQLVVSPGEAAGDPNNYAYVTPDSQVSVSVSTINIQPSGMADFAKSLDGSQIMLRTDGAGYKLATSTISLTAISDVDYPAVTVRGCVYLDGVFYVMEPDGTIWNSASEDCTSWAATDSIVAEFEPDEGVCLAKYNNYVVAFGQWTTQMFWDAANASGSPLSPVDSGVLLVGCAHANSVAQVESTLIWIAQRKGQGSSFQKGRFVAMLEGSAYVQVSTPDVDRIIDADDLATVYSCVGSYGGHNFYLLSLGTTGATLVYDLTTKRWYRWTKASAGTAVSVTSLTQSGGTATATATGHGFNDGDPITIAGASPAGYNQTYINVTKVDANTFTYPVSSALSSPATGTITATPVSESYFSMVSSCNYRGDQVFQEASGGNVYSLDDAVTQDNSVPINFKARSSNQFNGSGDRKFCGDVEYLGDVAASAATGLLRYTDDDFQTYSTYRRFDLTEQPCSQHRYGNYRRRAWEWRYTGTLAHRILALDVDVDKGA